jgi:hypothetical protein
MALPEDLDFTFCGMDAPSGAISGNGTPSEVFWTGDGKSVIVSNTYLPLNGVDTAQRVQRTTHPAIAEVELATGKVTPIYWEATQSDADLTSGSV